MFSFLKFLGNYSWRFCDKATNLKDLPICSFFLGEREGSLIKEKVLKHSDFYSCYHQYYNYKRKIRYKLIC